MTRRAALYLDFDNVLSILAEIDEASALTFVEQPGAWLRWLAEAGATGGPKRRFRILRAYMNAGGSMETRPDGAFARAGHHPRLYLNRFRQRLAMAGFELVDCPRVSRAKNAADMRMLIDVLDSLAGPAPPDEVVLLSSDSDFLPLLHRLRAHDVRAVLVAHPAIGSAMRASADAVIGLDEFAVGALGWNPPAPDHPGLRPPPITDDDPQPDLPEAWAPPPPRLPTPPPGEALEVLRNLVPAGARVHLPRLGHAYAQIQGRTLRESRYAGHGSLEALLEAAGLRLIPGPGGGWVEPEAVEGEAEG